MALAWPNIQVLRPSLDVSADETMANNLMSTAFHCLIPLARQCSKLTTLDIRLIGRVLPDMAMWLTLHHELVNLDLDVPRIIKPKPIAHMLHRIFPALVEVKAEGASDSYEYNQREWMNMGHTLRALKSSTVKYRKTSVWA
jgi:hypothetical protein